MLTWVLVIVAMLGGGLLGSVWLLGFPLIALERSIQWAGRDEKQWAALGVETPGERLPAVSFLFGAAGALLARGMAYFAGLGVFLIRDAYPSLIPMVVCAIFHLINDTQRIHQFRGSSGQAREIGIFCGGTVAFVLFIWMRAVV